MTVRILHTADLHLDSPLRSLAMKDDRLAAQVRSASRQALETMVQYCIDEDVAAFLISGDLYDGQERSAKTAAYLAAQMHRLAQAGVQVFYIKGNHDAENPIAGEIDLPSNVHVFEGRGEKVQLGGHPLFIHGVSFRDRHAPESLLPKYTAPEPGAVNIAMMHTSLAGAEGHDLYAPVSVGELVGAGFDYWALGHIHKRAVHSETPWVVMPGMPQGRDIGEAGPKSATLLTVERGEISVSEVATSVVEFRRCDCDLTGVETDEDMRAALRSALQAQAGRGAAILRLRLMGQTSLAWQLRQLADAWRAQADEIAESIGTLWIEKMTLDVTPLSQDAADSAVSEVQQLMTEIAAEPASRDGLRQELSQILGLLPAEQRRALAPDAEAQEALLQQLTDDAVLAMAAQMRGAGT
ncbi:MAG: metallophosphoesterase family protein [Rhodobacterales bacterium]